MHRCVIDPCVLTRKWNGKTELIMGINIDDTLVLAKRKRVEWFEGSFKEVHNYVPRRSEEASGSEL